MFQDNVSLSKFNWQIVPHFVLDGVTDPHGKGRFGTGNQTLPLSQTCKQLLATYKSRFMIYLVAASISFDFDLFHHRIMYFFGIRLSRIIFLI